jgi:hypothetical protein
MHKNVRTSHFFQRIFSKEFFSFKIRPKIRCLQLRPGFQRPETFSFLLLLLLTAAVGGVADVVGAVELRWLARLES